MSNPPPQSCAAQTITRIMPSPVRALIDPADILTLGALFIGTPIASILPVDRLGAVAASMAKILPANFRQEAALDTFVKLGGFSLAEATALRRQQLEQRLISLAFFLKQLGGRRIYEITLEGEEHIAAALSQGRGAVIWIADFVFASDVTRQAFHSMGCPLTHLIRPEHGFSSTLFGTKWLNPIHAKVANAFLHECVVFDRNNPDESRHRLEQRLGDNGLVSILACAYEGRRLVQCPFLQGRLTLAAGAPAMAFKMASPILPVYTLPSPQAPHFLVSIGKPLLMNSIDKDRAIREATSDFVRHLEPYARAYPQLWRGWSSLVPA